MKIKIITDSTSDISKETADRYGITVVPLYVIIDGTVYRADELPPEVFYEKLDRCLKDKKPLPTTSQITPEDFKRVLEPYAGDGDTFVAVFTIAKEMSATYYSAQTAIKELGMKNVHLFDTYQTTFGLGALVCEAAKTAALPDVTAEEFVKRVEDLNSRVWIYVSIGDLKCLRAGGRLSPAAMALGNMLSLKPVVYIHRKVEVAAKALGQAKATRWIAAHVAEERDESLPVYFGHSLAENLIDDYREKYGGILKLNGDESCVLMGPVVGTHGGIGCAGAAFFRKRKD